MNELSPPPAEANELELATTKPSEAQRGMTAYDPCIAPPAPNDP